MNKNKFFVTMVVLVVALAVLSSASEQLNPGRPSVFNIGSVLNVGTNPATTGAIRLANDQTITWRNAANSGNIRGIYVASDDSVTIGNTGAVLLLAGSSLSVVGAFGNINTTGEFQSNGNRVGYNLSVYGAGTAYAFTNAAAAIDFGTTDPVLTVDKAGTYLISGQVHVAYAGATVAAETATIKVRRTNNTAADISVLPVIDLPVATTLTHSYGVVQIPPFVYTTAATNDSITLFGQVSATLGAGTINATAIGTSLVAIRLY